MNKVASKSSCPDCIPGRLRAMHYQQETVTDASTPCYTLNGFGSVYYTPCRVSWFSLEFLYSRIRTYTHRCTAGVCAVCRTADGIRIGDGSSCVDIDR